MMKGTKLCTILFNAVNDALWALEMRNYGEAEEILQHAQVKAEAILLAGGGQEEQE
jgi:hypothetical protein